MNRRFLQSKLIVFSKRRIHFPANIMKMSDRFQSVVLFTFPRVIYRKLNRLVNFPRKNPAKYQVSKDSRLKRSLPVLHKNKTSEKF